MATAVAQSVAVEFNDRDSYQDKFEVRTGLLLLSVCDVLLRSDLTGFPLTRFAILQTYLKKVGEASAPPKSATSEDLE